MSKYTVSKLESIDKLSDNDLLLVSHDNGDGTYSSVNVPFSVITEAIDESSDSVGGIGNGTTDTIGYFSPTTRAHVVESQFYDATTKSAILLKSGSHVYSYCSAEFNVFEEHSSGGTAYDTETDTYKTIKNGQQIAGNLPLNIQKVTHTDTEAGTTTYYFVAKDLYNTCNKYTRKSELLSEIQSKIAEITFNINDKVYVETSTGDIAELSCATFDRSTSLTADYKITNTQRNNLVTQGYNIIIKGEYSQIRPLFQVINDLNFSSYFIKPPKADNKTATAKNTPVYTDELTIKDDSAIYIFGSFTCDETTSKGESYYFEIQICCPNGDNDWFPIYRQYSTQPNAKSRTTVNYQIFAKAGVKLRGYIAPQGSSNNVYYNLSNFSFTQCIVNGKFNNVEKFDIIQIPYLNSVSTSSIDVEPTTTNVKGYWITIEGAFSRHGAFAGDKDNSNNLYFAAALNSEQPVGGNELDNFTPLHTVVLSTKNAIYSTYKYFIQTSSTVNTLLNIFASNKLGNNSNYSPYGSNAAKIDYTESTSSLDQLLTEQNLTDAGDCTILTYDPTKNTPTKKINGTPTPYIAKSFNDSTNPSARIGVSKISQSSTNELYVSWKRDGQSYEILENATGATSLYWMPLKLKRSGTTYDYDIASSATLKISNQINSFSVSSAKNNAQINTAKRLTSVSKFGSAITSLDDYCFFKCTSLTSVASSNNITSIGESCFQGCTLLAGEVTFPKVTTLGANAFNGCTNLATISMSDAVIEVVPAKFAYKCTNLATVYMSMAKVIEEDAFNGTKIAAITNEAGSGSRFDEVTTIKKNAFANNAALSSVTLLKCAFIGESAFSKCTSLASLTLEENTIVNKTIGKNAFNGCPLTGTIQLGHVTSIENGAFSSADKNSAVFVINNNGNLPELKSINAFPNNASKNTWKIRIPDESVRSKVATDKVWRQLINRVVAQ